MSSSKKMPVGGDANWHNAVAIALGLPTSLRWDQLVDEVYALRRRAGELSYANGDGQQPRKYVDEPILGFDQAVGT
jgi:hypothetical protein